MSADRKVSDSDNIGIGDISGFPPDIKPDEFLKGLIESFNRSASGLKEAYQTLQDKFDKLNLRLEETNLELKNSLEEKERLSNYLTNILESLSSGVIVVDTGGIITHFNRGAEEITGIKGDKAVNRPYTEIIGSDTPEELTPVWVLAHNESRSQMEKTIVSKNGDNIPVGFSISPLLSLSGELLGAVEIFMDLSNIKALEDELSRMDKLAALGQMSATMAHKIRNPLGGIVGYAGLLATSLDRDEKCKRHTRKIIEGVEKIDHIISSVLTYNSQLNISPSEINLTEIVNELIAFVKHNLDEKGKSSIGFTVTQPDEPVRIEADAEHLNIALSNILQNAIEAIEGEGKIDIRIMSGSSQMKYSCPLTSALLQKIRKSSKLIFSQRPCSIITITDSGEGMDKKVFKNLFVPFFTTKEKGIGLGLASAQKIIDAHHGETWIESSLNIGSAVGIILPMKSTV
ncbi:nitrogen regulation protein NR(II) [Candidatus Latescibacterota bacterium]